MESLKEFQERGGEIVLLDTGSTDSTPEIARGFGIKVTEVGEKYIIVIDDELAKKLNERFIVDGEEPIAKGGDKIFNYSGARNEVASLASNNIVSFADCDEKFEKLDIDAINQKIREGVEQFEYHFVFSYDSYGREAIKFIQSKMYDRRKLKWVNLIHEVLSPIDGNIKREFLPENIFKLVHHQNPSQNRDHYPLGLALDCYLNPDNDRNSHYCARELYWRGRPKSAIKEFERHIAMNRWPAERAQSMIFMGDCYGMLNEPEKQVEWYNRAFYTDSTRREALIKLARFYHYNNNPYATAAYAAAAMEIPWNGFYANDLAHYTFEPHEHLYWARGWLGDVSSAQAHLLKALEYHPLNPTYLRDLRFYFRLPKISIIIPTLGREEGLDRCLKSIQNLNYPQELIETIVIEDNPRLGVPKRVKEGVERSTGEYIIYAANDIEFTPDSVILAWREFQKYPNLILVAFNTGEVLPDEGNICEHFMFKKSALPDIGGEIFDTEFHHVGVDNLLWAKCKRLNAAKRCEDARVNHYHFSKGATMDDIYKLGWSKVDEDRALLKKKLAELEQTPSVALEYYNPADNKIEGWMSWGELDWLYNHAKAVSSVVEVGSWMGRSTHALLSGCRGIVYSVDHFLGSADPMDTGNRDVYPDFIRNVGHFKNLRVVRKYSLDAAKDFEDNSVDMVFIDAGHQYHEVKADIEAWLPKATKIISGHDYNWPSVAQAVDEKLGKIELYESIWWLDLTNPLMQLQKKIENGENFSFVKMGDGEMLAMLGVEGENCDGSRYNKELGERLKEAYRFLGKQSGVQITKWKLGMEKERERLEKELGIECTANHDLLLNRVGELSPYHYNFWKAIKNSKRKKIFVGPRKLEGVVKMLNIDSFVEIPEKNAYENPINLKAEENAIYLFSSGFASKIWIAELLKQNKNITCIDCGSAFDPIFVGQTRANQVNQDELKEFYAELLVR